MYFGIKHGIKDLRLPNDFKWLLKTCGDFQKLPHFLPRTWACCISNESWSSGKLIENEKVGFGGHLRLFEGSTS